MNKIKLTIILTLFAALCTTAYGQVTIGSNNPPNNGALLDLNDQKPDATDNTTAKKGMMLPRVELSDLNKLYPMFNSGYAAGEDKIHTGLTVYNLKQCDGKFARGVYTWTGTEWVQLTNNPILTGGDPTLTFPQSLIDNSYLVRIPSGQDARGTSTSQAINFTWGNASEATWSNLTDNYSGSMSGGLAFSDSGSGVTPAGVPGLTGKGTWTTAGASVLTITPDDLSSLVTATDPWKTRQSLVTISVPAGTGGGPCPGGGTDQSQTITLNQTNYKIVPGAVASPTTLLMLHDATSQSLDILSNARWEATASNGTATWSDILDSNTSNTTINTPTGSELHDGDWNTDTFNYTSTSTVVPGKKYETAQITFSDVAGRAKPVTVTVMQCQGTPDMSSVTITATDNNDPDWKTNWGTNVVRHAAKPVDPIDASQGNIYEEFYSADFGAAGRWMTTNLAAWKYDDGVTHPVTNTSTLGVVDCSLDPAYSDPYYCYPNGGSGGTTTNSYDNNKHLGFFYNWSAATAGRGGDDGYDNIANEGGNNNYAAVQGICPAGWHLPSDWEWTELENEIIKNTTDYAYVSQNISSDGMSNILDGTETGFRGWTLGQAMKEVCGVNSIDPDGLSKNLAQNGFNVLLAGFADGLGSASFGDYAYFWSSSSFDASNAWYREMSGNATVNREANGRCYLYSVRCLPSLSRTKDDRYKKRKISSAHHKPGI
ncbi:FISUMP domain-containing protein [Dysgonomonas sp.]